MLLTQDQEMIRDAVRDFAQTELWPNAARWDKEHHFPKEAHQGLAALGAYGICVPEEFGGANLDYVTLALVLEEIAAGDGGTSTAISVTNCPVNAILLRYGNAQQKRDWLTPLARGEMLGAFCLTEPHVGSDASALRTTAVKQGDEYVINGRKWWISGAADPRCAVFITMGKSDPEAPKHSQQSMVLVPADTPGIKIIRPLNVFGYDDAPHGHVEMTFENVRVPVSNILLGEGRGFEIAQGRLGPGRIHHCMRLIGLAERALELMCKRASSRVAFGKTVAQQTVTQERIAEARCKIDMARLLTLKAAWLMDVAGNKVAKTEIAMIKVVAPSMACQVIDWAMQAHGGGGMCDDFPLAYAYAGARTLRFADGPDEVHRNAIAKWELGKYGSYGRDAGVPITRGA